MRKKVLAKLAEKIAACRVDEVNVPEKRIDGLLVRKSFLY